jgi:predicted nucleic-acid-binding protein
MRNYKVFFPRAGIVEAASVLKRSGLSREQVLEVLESLNKTSIILSMRI